MKKIVLLALTLCLAVLPMLFSGAQAEAAAVAAAPAGSVAGLILSVFPITLWAPMLITLVIMVGNVIW